MNVKIIKNYMGWLGIIFLSLIPLIFLSWEFTAVNLGRAAGLVGMAMFSLIVILSARLKVFEKIFWGINEAYVAHHFFAGIAFTLILSHPLFLAYNFISISLKSAVLFFLPSSFWPVNFGIFALYIMIVVLLITYYLKSRMKYQRWKFIHKFMGTSYIFAVLHVFTIGSNVAQNQFLKIYFIVLSSFAITGYFYRTLAGSYLVKRFKYIVEGVRFLPDKTTEIELRPAGEAMKFVPGQFVFIKFYSNSISRETHPFTISSASDENNFRLSIKESGDWTKNIKNLKTGDSAKIEGPFGKFNFRNYNPPAGGKKQIWIAGGIGVTPFLSMARDLKKEDKDYNISFYYSAKTEDGFIFKEELEKISEKFKNLKIIFWVSEKDGLLTAERIAENVPDAKERDILICGPVSMMTALKKQFIKIKVNKNNIHTEEFQL